jgi:hypothetical protein
MDDRSRTAWRGTEVEVKTNMPEHERPGCRRRTWAASLVPVVMAIVIMSLGCARTSGPTTATPSKLPVTTADTAPADTHTTRSSAPDGSSTGPSALQPGVAVPNLVNLTPYDATHQLALIGLQVETQGTGDPYAGIVWRQSPVAGTMVAKGSTVVLSVSSWSWSTSPERNIDGPTVTVTSTTPADAGTTVLLTEVHSQASYYNQNWYGYEQPIFALWPNGRMLVREKGGYASPPAYLEVQLTGQQTSEVALWLEQARLSSLAASYPHLGPTQMTMSDATEWRLRAQKGNERTDVSFELGYPVGDDTFPAALDTLVKRLESSRPEGAHPFVSDRIEVYITKRSRKTASATGYFPLPTEFDLEAMEVVSRNEDGVRYRAHYSGKQAELVAARIDAGEWLYVDAEHSYWLQYRPLLDWPSP